MSTYEVCAKCGHVGRGYYVEKTFAVKAESAKEAAKVVRGFPRVKHHQKDAIRYVNKIDEVRYDEIIEANRNDNYFVCHSVQEQRAYTEVIIPEWSEDIERERDVNTTSKHYYNGKVKVRNPKKYIGFMNMEGRLSAC